MTEEAELQAKIAAISGKINQHRQRQQPLTPNAQYHQAQYHASRHSRGRWSPYGRGGRAGYPTAHKNRTLVLGGNQKTASPASDAVNQDATDSDHSAAATEGFVTSRGPGVNSLMNKDTYDRVQKQKLEQKEQTRTANKQQLDREERSKLIKHAAATSSLGQREMLVEGIRFQLREDGSKLIRVTDPSNLDRQTPKKAKIADVDFFRTKNGNLVRASAVRDLNRPAHRKSKLCENFVKHGTLCPSNTNGPTHTCLTMEAGKCPYGPNCKFTHDPDKVAICKDYLRTGTCAVGDYCDLSHDPTYERVPACTHFLRGNCINDACRYPHVHVSPAAAVCRSFASLGFCSRGEECAKRHVFECPDYANHGYCANRENGKCPLPHPDRASTLRKAAARQSKTGSEEASDMSSDEEAEDDVGLDDIDSDEAEDLIIGDDNYEHDLTQQKDYIAFS